MQMVFIYNNFFYEEIDRTMYFILVELLKEEKIVKILCQVREKIFKKKNSHYPYCKPCNDSYWLFKTVSSHEILVKKLSWMCQGRQPNLEWGWCDDLTQFLACEILPLKHMVEHKSLAKLPDRTAKCISRIIIPSRLVHFSPKMRISISII